MAYGRLAKPAERLAVCRSRIRRAKDKRQSFFEGEGEGMPPGADFAIDVYRGNTKPKGWPDGDIWCHTGKLTSAVRSAIPTLMYANPRFRVFPAAQDIMDGVDVAYARAQAKELWLNHIWRESNGNQHARCGINNAFFSLGVIKCGYLPTFQDCTERGEWEIDEATGQYIVGEDGDPVLARGKILKDEYGEAIRDEYGIPVLHPGNLTKEKWFIEVTDARMMLFDPDGGPDFYQHGWVGEEWVRPLEEVKNDPRYSAAVRKRLTASEDANDSASHRSGEWDKADANVGGADRIAAERDEERLRGYDIYDFVNQRYYVIPDGGTGNENQDFLLDVPMPPGMEQGPYRFLKYTEDVGTQWYPIPDATNMALLNQQYDMNESTEAIHRSHTKSRYLVQEGAFDTQDANAEQERAKFCNGPDGTLINVTDINKIQPAPKAYLDPSFAGAAAKLAMAFNEVGGMPGEMRGVADSETATQASILATGAEIRNNDRRDNQVQGWLCEIGRALLISGQANMEMDSVVLDKIEDATGVRPFRAVKLTQEELLGEFEVTVEIGSTMNKSDPRMNAQIAEFVKTIAQNAWIAQDDELIARWLDGIGIDPVFSKKLAELAKAQAAAQNAPAGSQGAPTPSGQVLPAEVLGALGNAAAGAPTGAPVN